MTKSKKTSVLILVALAAVFILGAYYLKFYDRPISSAPEDWAHFSAYVGGVLAPILTFASIYLLIESITKQSDANRKLELQIAGSRKEERYRTFENTFYHLLQRLTEKYDRVVFIDHSGEKHVGATAISMITSELVSTIKLSKDKKSKIKNASDRLENLDLENCLYNSLRSFYLIIKRIDDDLSDEKEFSIEDRKRQVETLINLTDFDYLVLLNIIIQYTNSYHPSRELVEHDVLVEVSNKYKIKIQL